MLRRYSLSLSLIGLILLLLVPCSYPQTGGKQKVTSQADLPRFTYPIKGSASELLQSDDATFDAFASKVRSDLTARFAITRSATRQPCGCRPLDLQQLAGENQAALETVASLRAEASEEGFRIISASRVPATALGLSLIHI